MKRYDVIVIGGGHAGVEAAAAACRRGASVALITKCEEDLGAISCNPSIGGLGKSQLIAEIDALGGVMGQAADHAGIGFRILNASHGAATQALRAQIDRTKYREKVRGLIAEVDIIFGDVKGLDLVEKRVGVEYGGFTVEPIDSPEADSLAAKSLMAFGSQNGWQKSARVAGRMEVNAKAIVIAAGTFINSVTHMGDEKRSAGRMTESGGYQDNDSSLSPVLRAAGFEIRRFSTSTPARLIQESIDFSGMERQGMARRPAGPIGSPEADSLAAKSLMAFGSRKGWQKSARGCALREEGGDESLMRFSNISEEPRAESVESCFITRTTDETHQIIRDNISKAPMYSGDISGSGPRYCPSIEDKIMRFPEHRSHQIFLEPEGLSGLVYPNGLFTSFGADIQDKFLRSIPGLSNVRIAYYGYAIEYDAIDARELRVTLEAKRFPLVFFAGQVNGTSGYEEAAAQGLVAGANAAAGALGLEHLVLDRTNSFIGVLIDDITTLGVKEPYRMFTSRSEYRLSLRCDNAVQRLGKMADKLGLITEKQKAALEKNLPRIEARAAAIDKIYFGYIGKQYQDMEKLRQNLELKIPDGFDYLALPGLTLELRAALDRQRPETIHALGRIQGITPAGIMVVLRKVRSKVKR